MTFWYSRGTVPPFVHGLYLPFSVSIYPFLVCHLSEYRIHSYIVHIMHELLFFYFSVGELVAIFLSTKIHIEVLNTFTFILTFYVLFWCYHAPLFISFLFILCLHLCLLVHLGHLCQFGFFPRIAVPCLHYSFMWHHPWHIYGNYRVITLISPWKC